MPALNYNEDLLDQYPHLLAGTYARFVDEREVSAQHSLLLALFEALLKYVTAAALGQYLQAGGADLAISSAMAGMRRPSLGHWAGLLRQVLAWRRQQNLAEEAFVFPELARLYARPTADLPAGMAL